MDSNICRYERTSRRVRRKQLENNSLRVSVHQWVVRANPLPPTFNFSFKRGTRGGPKLITAFNTFVVSFLDYATSIYINGFIPVRLWSDLQFPALETVILRDIISVHDESTVFSLHSGPARHPRLVGSSGLRALPFLSPSF